MRLPIHFGLALISLPIVLCSCANLKEIGAFAATSQQIMEKNRTVRYGYYAYYHDSTYIYHSLPADLNSLVCHCEIEKKADTSIMNECALLSVYFGNLAMLTDPSAAIDLNPLGLTVVAGTYGMISITDEESGIASALGVGLSDLFTTGYKSRKLKGFVRIYRDSVAPLIGLLAVRANNLAIRMGNLQAEVRHDADSLIRHTSQAELKWSILFSYEREMKDLAEVRDVYMHRAEDLNNILKGGEFIYENADHLRSADFRTKLRILVSNLSMNANLK